MNTENTGERVPVFTPFTPSEGKGKRGRETDEKINALYSIDSACIGDYK